MSVGLKLEELWTRANVLAQNFDQTTIQSLEFQDVLKGFLELQNSSDRNLQKIGRLAHIFGAHWSQRQWLNLIVPLERYLDRRLTDPDILGALPDNLTAPTQKVPLYVIADHWRSAFNVGALFRLADGFGVEKIFLTGYTPTPDTLPVRKTAMGSESLTPWEHWEQTPELIRSLKLENKICWALETSSTAQTLGAIALPQPLVIILGNERFGLDPKILALCENTVKIPLRGQKNSMNVANCFGIFAYEWCRQNVS